MPPTVLTYLPMISSAVWAASGVAHNASPASRSITVRIGVPRSKMKLLRFLGLRLQQLPPQRMAPPQHDEGDHGAHEVAAEDPDPGELPQTGMRQNHRQHHESELEDEKEERRAQQQAGFARRALHHRHRGQTVG